MIISIIRERFYILREPHSCFIISHFFLKMYIVYRFEKEVHHHETRNDPIHHATDVRMA